MEEVDFSKILSPIGSSYTASVPALRIVMETTLEGTIRLEVEGDNVEAVLRAAEWAADRSFTIVHR